MSGGDDGPVRDAMIVAGGRGTRLQPLTFTCHKPLLPFCGAPFLAGVIERLARIGVRRVFLVVGQAVEPFAALEDRAERLGVVLRTVPEPEPLDTAGGVRAAIDDVDGTVLVLNGDILTDVDLPAAVAHHREAAADATLVLTRVDDTSSYGVCVREGTRIVDFVEKPAPGSLPDQDAVNAGTYVLEPEALAAFPRGELSFERDVFPGIVSAGGHLEGFVWDGVWQDLGTPERWRAGHRLALSGELSWPPLEAVPGRDGVRVAAGATVEDGAWLVGPVLVLGGATVAEGARVGPDVVVGAGAHVGGAARLEDTILFDRAAVGPGVTARGLIAGRGAAVEESARLGDDVVLGDGQVVAAGTTLDDGARVPPPG